MFGLNINTIIILLLLIAIVAIYYIFNKKISTLELSLKKQNHVLMDFITNYSQQVKGNLASDSAIETANRTYGYNPTEDVNNVNTLNETGITTQVDERILVENDSESESESESDSETESESGSDNESHSGSDIKSESDEEKEDKVNEDIKVNEELKLNEITENDINDVNEEIEEIKFNEMNEDNIEQHTEVKTILLHTTEIPRYINLNEENEENDNNVENVENVENEENEENGENNGKIEELSDNEESSSDSEEEIIEKDIKKLKVNQLKNLAIQRGHQVSNVTKMKRNELIELLQEEINKTSL